MKTNYEEQKQEAITRLQSLKLHPNVLREFKEGMVNQSESIGILFWVDEKIKATIDEFEKEHNAIVYHVIFTPTQIGKLYSFFYVSNSKDEWEDDRKELKDGYPIVYVYNMDDDYCSEFGSIGFRAANGGLVRTD